MKIVPIETLIPEFLRHSTMYFAIVVNMDGTYSYLNDFFNKKFSFLSDDLIGKPYTIAIHPEDIKLCETATNECIANNGKPTFVKIRKPDFSGKKYFWTSWEFSFLKDNDGNVLGMLCVGLDITEFENANKRIQEFSDKVEHIVENITDGFYVINKKWEFIKLNSVVEKTLGTSKRNILGRSIWDFYPKSSEYKYPYYFQKAMDEQISVQFQEYAKESNRWFDCTAYPSEEGLTILFRDITQQKKSEELLIDSENKLRAILDSTSDTNFLISPENKILSFNKTAEKEIFNLFGKKLAEGQDFTQYLFKGEEKDYKLAFEKALKNQPVILEREIFLTEKQSCWFEVRYFPVYDKKNGLIGVTFNASNIDQRKQAEKKILEQNKSLREIAHTQSHNVRGPVATILGIVYLLQQEPLDSSLSKKLLGNLLESARKLDRVIHSIIGKTEL